MTHPNPNPTPNPNPNPDPDPNPNQDSYPMLDEILAAKMADKDLVSVVKTMFNACGTITEALRSELVTVADNQNSAFGDVQR